MIDQKYNFKWKNYFLCQDKEFDNFWKNYLNNGQKDLLFIIGLGFDPRMYLGAKKILSLGGKGKRNCFLLEYDEGEDSPSIKHEKLVKINKEKIKELFSSEDIVTKETIKMVSEDGKYRKGPNNARKLFRDFNDIRNYSDIIIDISAMPYSIYFPIIEIILSQLEEYNKNNNDIKNLHVIVAENEKFDENIKALSIQEAKGLSGLDKPLILKSKNYLEKIWIPILGEGKEIQLKKIYDYVSPIDICFILPFPSRNPRRGDNIFLDYRDFIFSKLGKTDVSQNILYASEKNPFDVSRQIINTVIRYNKSLKLIGGCICVISTLSSKIMSLGALLATYDLQKNDYDVGIAYTEAKGYNISQEIEQKIDELEDNESSSIWLEDNELFSIWLEGECYID
ncbi:MAG: hypothetical protein GF308_10305 [Candidatus Heimdallarchaeota archaeon]|nr:hypothetical protein [Candidatus Heimdallarchaeota archaeon]